MLPDKAAGAATTTSRTFSHWFANAANVKEELSPSILNSVWAHRIIITLQTFAVPFAFWFKPICVCVALFWLVYRASQVLNKPLTELSYRLGFDIPSTPLVDLAGIKADGAIVHWNLAEKPKQKSQLKFEIILNSAIVDSVAIHESAVTITGLQPSSYYVVRVVLIHNNDFSSRSAPLRFRTKPAASGDFFVAGNDGHETEQEGAHEQIPRLRPYRGLKNITSAMPAATPMSRENSMGLGVRRVSGRRASPAVLEIEGKHDPHSEDSEPPEGSETVQQLTERLAAIRRETEEAEKQAKQEEEEDLRQKEELIRERDALKAEFAEKEKTSRNLKREVNTLERQNTAAQTERAKQERILQQKTQERQKLKDDTVRWEREVEEMNAAVVRIQDEKAKYLERAAKEKETLRVKQVEESAKLQVLDEEYKEKAAEVKKLDRALKNGSPGSNEPETNLVQQMQNDAEEERSWQIHKHALQQQYQMAYNRVESSKRFYAEQIRYLETLRAERRRQDEMARFSSPPSTQERPMQRANSQRSRHAPSRYSGSDSPRLGAFAPAQSSPFASSINPAPPGFSSAPFLNIQNGMTIAAPTDDVSISDEDRERLTGGATMSPSVGEGLIPADLFNGDGDKRKTMNDHVQPLPGLGGLPGLPALPSQLVQENAAQGPASPGSVSSRSPSVFVSPQASQHNLHIGSPEHVIDADRRSIRSTRSSRATSGGNTSSRFSGMFGIKARNKTMSEDGPPLAKSSSMPRQDIVSGLDSLTRKRNSSISGTVFDGGLDGSTDPAGAPSKKGFGLFSREKSGGWPSNFAFGRRPTSPRPVSTHSNELPRPSMDSSRWGVDTWPSSDAASGARSSPLAFGSGWNLPGSQQSRLYGSRHPSRRPSVQYNATGPPEDIMEDEDSDALDSNPAANLAPIGTKPSKKAVAEGSAKLNPNAKDFKSFFSSMKFSKGKDAAATGPSENADGSTPVPSPSQTPGVDHEESPPNSRKSRDTRSVTNTETTDESGERNSTELDRTPSYSNSDAAAPSPSLAGSSKETFMQKITRKSSSSKFSMPTFRRERSRLDPSSAIGPLSSTPPTSAPPPVYAEDEEEGMSASVGSLPPRESKDLSASRGSRTWSSVLKIGKGKKGGETPSQDGEDDEDEA